MMPSHRNKISFRGALVLYSIMAAPASPLSPPDFFQLLASIGTVIPDIKNRCELTLVGTFGRNWINSIVYFPFQSFRNTML